MRVNPYSQLCVFFSLLIFLFEVPAIAGFQMVQGIDYIKQSNRNYCGGAALAMLLNYWSEDMTYSELEIVQALYNQRTRIIYNSDMVYYANREGFKAYSFHSHIRDLKRLIDQGIPVIVLQKPVKRIKKGHYRIVFGYDDDFMTFFIHDPMMGAIQGIKYQEFLELWNFGDNFNKQNWALAIIPQDKESLFQDLLKSYVFHANMATAYYKRKAYQDSILEWKMAISKTDADPLPYYCLAQVLLDLDRPDEAIIYAKKAVEIDGEDPFALDVLGLTYHKQGMLFEAAETLVTAVKLREKKHKFILKHWLKIRDDYIQWKKGQM